MVDIRPIRDEEIRDYLDAISTGFMERPDLDKLAEEVRPHWDLARSWAAFDGSRISGTFRSWATELTVPGGGRIDASAIAAVTVLPSHRRRGILRSLVAAEHAAIRERGEVAGVLHASEWPIYGRFGYGVGTREATWTIGTRATSFYRNMTGRVDLIPADEHARDTIKAVFDTWRERQPGEIRRRDFTWDHEVGLVESAWGQRWKGFIAVHRDDGTGVDGYVRYHVDDKWEQRQPQSTLVVDELHALTDDAHRALWRFVVGMDWVSTVRAANRSPSEPLPWLLTNGRAAAMSDVGDSLWVRIIDVARALEARGYRRELAVVLEIVDPEAVDGRIRLELDAGPDGVSCRRTNRSADLTLHVAALGAAYLGGTRLADVVLPTGADEHREGALADVEDLLRSPVEPWCSTFF
jgi:predicted acetyltransferase